MILDTNALSAWRDGDTAILKLIGTPRLVLPVITLGEYRYGISRLQRASSAEDWLEGIVRSIQVVPITTATASSYALVRSDLRTRGKPIPENDIWIAALAIQHSLPVLSRDQHFDVVDGVERVEW